MIVVRWLYASERGSRAPRVERFETAASARRWIRAAREAARRHPEEDAIRIIDSSPPLRDRIRTSRRSRRDPKREREREMRKALESARGSFKDMAQRRANAEERFLAYAQERAGLTRAEAERALVAYRRAKAIKFDVGQFTFTHGGFADAVVLRRAAGIEK